MPPPSNETNRIREFSLSRLPHMEENPVACGYCMSSFEIPGIFLDSLKSSMPGGSKWLQTFWNKAAAYNGALVSSETRLSCLACTARVARSLRGKNIRSEKVPQRGQFFDLLRRIVGLRKEKVRKNGPLWCLRSRHTFYRADS